MKRRLMWYSLALVLLASAAWAQGDGTEQAVAALEQKWLQAQQTNNSDLVAPLLADKIVDTSSDGKVIDKAGVLFQTGYFMRSEPIHRFLREQIAAGAFGKITRIRHTNCHSGSLGGWFDTEWRWMTDLKQAGIGGFGDLGTHSLDILMWLMGDISNTTATIKVATGRYGDCGEFDQPLALL